ncbi:hypothetical protein N24_0456 [Corynebacterium suranareeae]|uniref:Uncharacterized protein n=1 Tax=Corynebacterium suranareeae TaxID=2506452 RepID=A0A161JNB9_9CORY|nr:hypothetical protein [Corynebacterium suranareeae]BAU94718.1 hypothetical protein N24_0456 [Corynebacterium suranareeae]
MKESNSSRFEARCFFYVSPATHRDSFIESIREWLLINEAPNAMSVSPMPAGQDQVILNIGVEAKNYSDAESMIDRFIDSLIAGTGYNSGGSVHRGSELLASA